MTEKDMGKITEHIDSQLKVFATRKIDMSCEEVENELRKLERKEYKEKFIKNNNCNLITCRYNQSGTCANGKKRKECVEVSKRVLCLEGENNATKRD